MDLLVCVVAARDTKGGDPRMLQFMLPRRAAVTLDHLLVLVDFGCII